MKDRPSRRGILFVLAVLCQPVTMNVLLFYNMPYLAALLISVSVSVLLLMEIKLTVRDERRRFKMMED